jgi:hypothetical protein
MPHCSPARIRHRRSLATVSPATVLLGALLAIAAAGCGADEPTEVATTTAPPGSAGLGDGPGDPSATSDPGNGNGNGNGNGDGNGDGQLTGDYPDAAREYAEAVIAAWHAADLDRLADLTTPMVHEQILQIPGPPSATWSWIQCDNIAYCSFYNDDGDYLVLQTPTDQLGQPGAAVQVIFNSTTYPQDHQDYLAEFVAAWRNGNTARMQSLALPEVVEVYQQIPPAPVTEYVPTAGGGGLAVVLVRTVNGDISTHIGTTLLGGPQAIRLAVPED